MQPAADLSLHVRTSGRSSRASHHRVCRTAVSRRGIAWLTCCQVKALDVAWPRVYAVLRWVWCRRARPSWHTRCAGCQQTGTSICPGQQRVPVVSHAQQQHVQRPHLQCWAHDLDEGRCSAAPAQSSIRPVMLSVCHTACCGGLASGGRRELYLRTPTPGTRHRPCCGAGHLPEHAAAVVLAPLQLLEHSLHLVGHGTSTSGPAF